MGEGPGTRYSPRVSVPRRGAQLVFLITIILVLLTALQSRRTVRQDTQAELHSSSDHAQDHAQTPARTQIRAPVRRIGDLPHSIGGSSLAVQDVPSEVLRVALSGADPTTGNRGVASAGSQAQSAAVGKLQHQGGVTAHRLVGDDPSEGDQVRIEQQVSNETQQQQGDEQQGLPKGGSEGLSTLAQGKAAGVPLEVVPSTIGSGSGGGKGGGGGGGGTREAVFLFTGILSGRGYRHRRLAVRETWANKAQVPGLSVARFVLSEDEKTPQVVKEMELYGDVAFAPQKTNYNNILYKSYHIMELAVTVFDAKFVLKTDDDAFINVPALLIALKQLCTTDDCSHERLYVGRMALQSAVLLAAGHKWNNILFYNHTGLRVYPKYALGGGYVLSGDVVSTLVDIQKRIQLVFTPIEDATVGFWLMALQLRHIDHPRFVAAGVECCFEGVVRTFGKRARFQLTAETEAHLCGSDPWLVLHKIESPTKMRYISKRFAECPVEEGRA